MQTGPSTAFPSAAALAGGVRSVARDGHMAEGGDCDLEPPS